MKDRQKYRRAKTEFPQLRRSLLHGILPRLSVRTGTSFCFGCKFSPASRSGRLPDLKPTLTGFFVCQTWCRSAPSSRWSCIGTGGRSRPPPMRASARAAGQWSTPRSPTSVGSRWSCRRRSSAWKHGAAFQIFFYHRAAADHWPHFLLRRQRQLIVHVLRSRT